MFTHRFTSTQNRLMPRGLAIALAVSLSLGVVPMATAARHASTVLVHSQSSGTNAVVADSDRAAQRSIIFVGGRKHADAHHVRAHPPGSCTPQTGSRSAGDDCSLNPQPIPPGHQGRDLDSLYTDRTPHRHKHKPVANPHKDD